MFLSRSEVDTSKTLNMPAQTTKALVSITINRHEINENNPFKC